MTTKDNQKSLIQVYLNYYHLSAFQYVFYFSPVSTKNCK